MNSQPTNRRLTTTKTTPSYPAWGGFVLSFIVVVVLLVALILLALYVVKQDRVITQKFEGKRWNIPAKIYSQPLQLYQGANLSPNELDNWLNLLTYRPAKDFQTAGTFIKKGNEYTIHTREFSFSNTNIEPNQVLKITLKNNQIEKIQSTQPNGSGVARLEPILIGGIYPDNNEDRIVLDIEQIPQPLIDALIATEDRTFYEHHGISLRGIGRAIYSNLTGGTRQGGSTITQQLVKNFYLSSDRTFKRKANEAIMAVLLEMHYGKNDILQTYLNEINLGQNGNHSINGVGLASQFYYNRPINELRLDQIAMLVGLAKGPTQYNPLRYPEQAIERRNVVLNNMLVMGKIDQQAYDEAIKAPLDVTKNPTIGKSRFPDYLDVVKRELTKVYQEEDLKNEGLRVFTSFDPNIQIAANNAVSQSLDKLRKSNPKLLAELQASLVSANPTTGELLAVVGSSSAFTGFNRAVDAKRQVGSLLKPIIYLTAFEQGKYNLASAVDDSPISVTLMNGETWTPTNYGGGSHGSVPLLSALANSYNQPAVRVGVEVGVPNIITQLNRMGIDAKLPNYPATLLGAVNLSPMDMLGVYQVLASGGYKHDIHTIRGIIDSQGRTVQGTTITNRQATNPTASYLTNFAMQQVIKDGTAKPALVLGADLNLAGKTGTTNDYRDAWFAGYSGNYVSVVWVGLDDNRPTGLSGGNGALPMWINFMQRLNLKPVNLAPTDTIEWLWLEQGTGALSNEACPNAIYAPVNTEQMPQESSPCAVAIYQREQEARFAAQQAQTNSELSDSQQQRLNSITNQPYVDSQSPATTNTEGSQPLNPETRSNEWLDKTNQELR
ncbi:MULTISPECIES: penicillin-binding protein 1B [unclassified Moraxella]|uniref:penicillin-binding protein 1B n=1 Tax=unclassified Moraxella TaxID=2685852 RepID=UPI003AF78151